MTQPVLDVVAIGNAIVDVLTKADDAFLSQHGLVAREIEAAIKQGDLIAASVLSGNRNFEGRVHPAVKAKRLTSATSPDA